MGDELPEIAQAGWFPAEAESEEKKARGEGLRARTQTSSGRDRGASRSELLGRPSRTARARKVLRDLPRGRERRAARGLRSQVLQRMPARARHREHRGLPGDGDRDQVPDARLRAARFRRGRLPRPQEREHQEPDERARQEEHHAHQGRPVPAVSDAGLRQRLRYIPVSDGVRVRLVLH